MTDWLPHLDSRRAALAADGLARELKIAEGAGIRLKIRGREVVSFGSNDYLGLSTHPRVVAAAKAALDEFGAGATASALICGHKTIHERLARALAEFKGAERALIFPSGFHAALASIGALADGDASVLLDKLAHASLIDGARLSGARVRAFAHNEVSELEALLEKESPRRCLIVIESLYSMDGDAAPLAEILALAERHGALLLVDEAHATGVLGERGRGLVDLPSLSAAMKERVIVLGTLSKALGAQGGFVCASEKISRAILTGRAHMFSTALTPASAAAALEALALIDAEPERRARVGEFSAYLRAELQRLKFPTPSTEGAIVPAIVGNEQRALDCAEALFERGFFVPAVRYPTVKLGAARLRISLSAAHSREECERLVQALEVSLR
ncbi:MAG TPA: 8-amino-7-oxononanoate synthase [Planctomycetota bacterium]|nr:8-amino-7-oxononanoate synthase [Planctomycetota bacterium]